MKLNMKIIVYNFNIYIYKYRHNYYALKNMVKYINKQLFYDEDNSDIYEFYYSLNSKIYKYHYLYIFINKNKISIHYHDDFREYIVNINNSYIETHRLNEDLKYKLLYMDEVLEYKRRYY